MTRFSVPSIRIPFRQHLLGNGMRVIAHEDHGAPIVAVHLMYHAGSRHERPGRTGLAHLLEHLMFEGSEHAPKGAFDDLLERAGGTNNGSTWLDRTNYYEVVPSHAVELALWLERDRMAHFLPVLGEEMLELQRGVVINERKQHYENRPYGMADERLGQLLFPGEHPYGWPTIGYIPDLEAITLEDARTFYRTYYTPSNSVLVFAGDVAADDAFALAERYYGDLPAGPALPANGAAPSPAPGHRRETLPDRVSFPRVYRAWDVPAYGTPDWVALDVLAYLLGDGDSSRLQRALVRDGRIAQETDTYLYPTELRAVFGAVATARSGVPAEALEETLHRTIGEVAAGSATEEEVTAALRRVRRDQVADLATVEGRAEALAYAATVLGGAERLDEVMEAYARVTPEDVARVAAEHLRPEAGATVVVAPAGEEARDAA
ncbi:MAG TPA: pitrilysin family protein [Longimicrobiaceae bacterium]|nr:pitrilysin family protein [Longimicrobiaceae bacterium]